MNDFTSRLTAVIKATSLAESPVETTASVLGSTATVITERPLIIVSCGFVATNFVKRFQANYKGTLNILEHLAHSSAVDWQECIKHITIKDSIATLNVVMI